MMNAFLVNFCGFISRIRSESLGFPQMSGRLSDCVGRPPRNRPVLNIWVKLWSSAFSPIFRQRVHPGQPWPQAIDRTRNKWRRSKRQTTVGAARTARRSGRCLAPNLHSRLFLLVRRMSTRFFSQQWTIDQYSSVHKGGEGFSWPTWCIYIRKMQL